MNPAVFDTDLGQRGARGSFDTDLFQVAWFDTDLIPTELIAVSLVGYADPDSFGIGRLAERLAAIGLNDADSFGSESLLAFRFTAAGLNDPDHAGTDTAKFPLTAIGLSDADNFGVEIGRITLKPVGLSDADTFGTEVFKFGLFPLGFLDPYRFGTEVFHFTNTFAETAFNDPDFFGTLHLAPTLRPVGFADTDFFGSEIGHLVLHWLGLSDPDFFGFLIWPHQSPRRMSRRRPFTGNIARKRAVRKDGVVADVFDIAVFDEPADIQNRQGSYLQQESGRVIADRVVMFLDRDSGLMTGDRFITSAATTYLVVNLTEKEKQLRADVERIVIP